MSIIIYFNEKVLLNFFIEAFVKATLVTLVENEKIIIYYFGFEFTKLLIKKK
jgi:hypothetical protein